MNIEQAGRLLTLAYFLKTEVKPKEFDMNSYWNSSWRGSLKGPPRLIDHPCNTSACAFGWCSAVFPDRFELSGGVFLVMSSWMVDLLFTEA